MLPLTRDHHDDPTIGMSLRVCCAAVGATVSGAIRPRRPHPGELQRIRQGYQQPAETRTTVKLTALAQVPREVMTWAIAEGTFRPAKSRIGLRSFVVEHPRARILVDPSVGSAVRGSVLAPMHPLLRSAVTPPPDILSTVEALHRSRIAPSSIDFAISTHLHWDHVSGLLDLPEVPLTVNRTEWRWATSGDHAPAAGVRPALRGRSIDLRDLDGPPILTFSSSHDLFGDGSVVLVDLAGHTPGSVGVLLHEERGWILIAGDAVWHNRQLTGTAQKAGFPGLLVDDDRDLTYQTLLRLAALPREITVLPCHDHDLAARYEQ